MLLGRRNPEIRTVIGVAFALRVLLTLSHNFAYALSDSGNAEMFEQIAWDIASEGPQALILHAAEVGQSLYSVVLAIPYSIFGRSVLLVHLINVVVGVLIVIQTYRLTAEVWDGGAARRAAWIVALLPSAAIYSAVLLREVFVVYPMLAALTLLVRWHRNGQLTSLAGGILLLVVAGAFHPGVLLALPVVVFSVIGKYGRGLVRLTPGWFVSLAFFVGVAVGVGYGAAALGVGGYKLESHLSDGAWNLLMARLSGTSERLLYRQDLMYSVGCARGPVDLVLCGPLRVLEFLAAPFPWRISRLYDLIRFAEATLVVGIVALGVTQLSNILAEPRRRLVFAVAFLLTLVFSLGSMELNQSHRHRSKLVPVFIALVAAAIPSVRLGQQEQGSPAWAHGRNR